MVFFHSHLAYLYLVWGHAKFSLNRITLLQKRPIRILHSAAYMGHTSPLFYRYKVLKFVDLVWLENGIFVNKCFTDESFSSFSNHFKLTAVVIPIAQGQSVSNGLLFKRLYNTFCYGNKSIQQKALGIIFKQFSMVTTYLICQQKKLNPLFLNSFLRTMKNRLYVFTIIVNIYLMYKI